MAGEWKQAAEDLKALSAQAKASAEALKKQAKEAKTAADQARAALATSVGGGFAGVASGGIRAFAQGGSSADVALGSVNAIASALPDLSQKLGGLLGAVGGPPGSAAGRFVGKLGGELAGAALERETRRYQYGLDQATNEVSRLGGGRAAMGAALSPEATAALFEAAFTRALRSYDYAVSARDNGLSAIMRARGGR